MEKKLQQFKTQQQLKLDKLNALKSQLADLEHAKLSKKYGFAEEKIQNLKDQIEKLKNECTTEF